MATRQNAAGWNLRCTRCQGWQWTIWSRHTLATVPALVAIAGDIGRARADGIVELELSCINCHALAAAYVAADLMQAAVVAVGSAG